MHYYEIYLRNGHTLTSDSYENDNETIVEFRDNLLRYAMLHNNIVTLDGKIIVNLIDIVLIKRYEL